MQQPCAPPGTEPPALVLASASAGGHQFEVIEFPDGSVAVRCDGFVPNGYRWSQSQIEDCMSLYMRLTRA